MSLSFHSPAFSDAVVILGAAGLVIPAFARAKISPVIGFILVGVAVGPFGLGALVSRAPWLYYVTISNPAHVEPFAELGIVLLLFAIGLELSIGRLWAMRRDVFGLGAAELVLGGLAIGTALHLIGQAWPGALGLGFALALSSTALVLPLVGTRGPVGRSAFAMLLFEDLALVPIIFVCGAMAPHEGGNAMGSLLQTLAAGAAVVAALFVGGRFLIPRLFAQAARTHSPELFLSASLLVAVLASAATTAAGLSPIVGALVAGVLIAETDYHQEVELITAPFRGLVLGIFLITVGMRVDLLAIAAQWPALVAAVIGVLGAKAVVTGTLLRLGGAKAGVATELGVLMASPSETTLIVLGAASAAGLIGPSTAAFWQTVTAVGLTLTPLLAAGGRALSRRAARLEPGEDAGMAEHEEGRTIIAGFGRVGRLVAQLLDTHDRPYLAVESDIDGVNHARERGYRVSFGDIGRPGMLERLGIERAAALVLTMDDPVQVVRLVRAARRLAPDLPIVARARDPNHAAELYRAGVTDAVPETVESSLQLSAAVLVELGRPMGPVIASIHETRANLRAKIMAMGGAGREPPIFGNRLGDEDLR